MCESPGLDEEGIARIDDKAPCLDADRQRPRRPGERALTYEEIRAFETALREAIERSDLAGAEALIRAGLEAAPDALLQEALDRPPDRLRIRGWHDIAADMESARRHLPEPDLDREWAAVLLGLINRNDVAGLPVSVKFTFDAEPARPDLDRRPSYMTDERFEAWQADNCNRIFLPAGARFEAWGSAGRLCLEGLEELRGIHDRQPAGASDPAGHDAVFTAQSLAAAIVLMRFHQLVELYVRDPGLPRPLPVFAYVETASWPMESGTVDYGTQATRRLIARADRYDPADTARVAERVHAEREAARLAETRQVVVALRELDLALSLWPRWRHPSERRRFRLLAGTYVDAARMAVARELPALGELSGLSGERLCEHFARARLGDEAALALDPAAPAERTAMHKLAIAYARKFGGPRLRNALAHVPPPPEELVRTGDYGL